MLSLGSGISIKATTTIEQTVSRNAQQYGITTTIAGPASAAIPTDSIMYGRYIAQRVRLETLLFCVSVPSMEQCGQQKHRIKFYGVCAVQASATITSVLQ